MSTDAPPRVGNPFVGPASFRLGDPLYGRDRELGDLLDLLVAERIVLLYSPSGAGKTSLIQAALAPALQEAGFEVLPVIRVSNALEPGPGTPTPRNRYVLGTLLSLEEGVPPARQRPVAELAALTLREYMDSHADRDGRPGNEVLLFDQFEEVLTADPTDEAAKHAFFRELGEMLRDRGHWALFAMREDFLAALDPYLRHVPTRFRSTFRLDLLAVPAALDAMRLPAERAGVDFTGEAADQLVDDLRRVRVQQPGGATEDALGSYVEPVQLQVACRLLWSSLPAGSARITRADVEALGDVDRALADYYADTVASIAAATGAREAAIREWFEECLITPQGLRGQVLEGPDADGSERGELLRRLVDAHLVRAERRRQATWYELAHDRLVEPVRRDNAAWRASHLTSFERAAALWAEQGRPDRLLLLGPDLAAAEGETVVRAGMLKPRERDFLDASRRADEQARRDAQTASALLRSARRLKRAIALVTLLALAAGFLLVQSMGARQRAEEARARAQAQEVASRLLLGAQRNLFVHQDLAVALAVAGAEMHGDGEGDGKLVEHARDVLYRAAESPVSLVFRGQRGATRMTTASDDARTLVTAGAEDIQLWDRETGGRQEALALREGEVVNGLDVNRDASTVVAGMSDGTLLVWQVGSSRPVRWQEDTGFVWTVDLAPDGQRLVSVGADNRVQVWDLDGRPLRTLTDPAATAVNSAMFSPDGSQVATASDAPEVVLWDATSGAETGRLPLPDGEGAWYVTFGSDANTLATITSSAVTVWDVPSWRPLHPPFTTGAGSARNLDADLARVLTVDSGYVDVYDLASGSRVARAEVPGASTWGAAFDFDPDRVLVVGDDIEPAFWDLSATDSYVSATAAALATDRVLSTWDDGTLRVWPGGEGPGDGDVVPGVDTTSVYELAADADGRRVAAVTEDGQVRVWDTATGTALAAVDPDLAAAYVEYFWAADLIPDGTELVTGDSAGVVTRWDAATGGRLEEVETSSDRGILELQVSPDGSTVLVALEAPAVTATDSDAEPEPVALLVPLSGGGRPVELRLPEDAALGPSVGGAATPDTVTAADFTRDGAQVVVGTNAGRVAAFDARDGDPLWPAVAVAHRGQVREVLVTATGGRTPTTGDDRQTATGGRILTTGDDRQVVVLDSAEGRRIRQVPSESDLMAAVPIPEGERLALFTADQGAVTVPLGDGELLDAVRSVVIHDLSDDECAYYRLPAGC